MWEYHILDRGSFRYEIEKDKNQLNELGNQGWELISTLMIEDTHPYVRYVFKRLKSAPPP